MTATMTPEQIRLRALAVREGLDPDKVAPIAPKPKRAKRERVREDPFEDLGPVERLAAGRQLSAARGNHVSGPAPYGYMRAGRGPDLTPRHGEAETVKLIFHLYRTKRSMKKVIDELTRLGSTTRRGKAWSRAGISWILQNPLYVGRVRWNGVERRGHHEPIVSAIDFNLVQKIVEANDKKTRQKS